jgi:hypothetical protein
VYVFYIPRRYNYKLKSTGLMTEMIFIFCGGFNFCRNIFALPSERKIKTELEAVSTDQSSN